MQVDHRREMLQKNRVKQLGQKPETPLPVEDPHDSTFILNPAPDRPARLSSSLSNRQRLSLLDIDGCICFITRDRLPTISIQDAHIVQRRLPKEIIIPQSGLDTQNPYVFVPIQPSKMAPKVFSTTEEKDMEEMLPEHKLLRDVVEKIHGLWLALHKKRMHPISEGRADDDEFAGSGYDTGGKHGGDRNNEHVKDVKENSDDRTDGPQDGFGSIPMVSNTFAVPSSIGMPTATAAPS
ncbi:hypothetical protein PILCRDRAFT_795665 [Piloderma croceum F 1598]|uniref:Uncharacterized protein n=1 Tax=Piloderma croceum (strain F 1598) TaxID=765440 RepID=A0A0C3AUK1_PILCF|nr:hypothetical protein PILCRDRAFT_795665 [Piloderma croceum F 1598]